MSTNEVIFEVLENTGLNWTVKKSPLVTVDGIEVPDKYGVIRSDNNKALGIVGNKYEFLQNQDMAHVIYDAGGELFDKGAKFKHPWDNSETLGSFGNIGGGSLKDGKAVFMQIELPDEHIGRSDIKRYITVTNFHDGSGSVGFGTGNQVVCCANTFQMAQKELSKFRHTSSMQQRIDEAVQVISRMIREDDKQMQVFEEASTKPIQNQNIREIVQTVFGRNIFDIPDDKLSTRRKNQVMALSQDIETSIAEQGSTLWALFNGVTRYTNHSTSSRDVDYGLMFGTEAKINERAYNTMLSWLNKEELV